MSEIMFVAEGSERGRNVLFKDRFKFVFHKLLADGETSRWTCAGRKKFGCKAYLKMVGSELAHSVDIHSHLPEEFAEDKCLMRTTINKKASDELSIQPTKDFRSNPIEYKRLPSEDSQDQSLPQCLNETVDFAETPVCMPEIAEVTPESPRTASKRKTAPQPSTSKMSKHVHDPRTDFMFGAIDHDQLDNVLSHRASHSRREDSYDCFGKYIASLLRDVGPPIALRLQATITSLVTNAMCSQPEQLGHSTSGAQTNNENNHSEGDIICESIVLIKSEN